MPVQRTMEKEFVYKFLDWDLDVKATSGVIDHGEDWDFDPWGIEVIIETQESGNDITSDLDQMFLPMRIDEDQAKSVLDDIKKEALYTDDWEFND